MLDHIDDDQIVLPGDTVVTSGVGEVFPAGLIVGEVIEVLRHNTGVGRYATVRPTRVIDAISEVFIITGFEPSE
jgi:rod shape-determining protein MreC